ncbi:hypothetical protein ACFX13_016696 [Malus domestica]
MIGFGDVLFPGLLIVFTYRLNFIGHLEIFDHEDLHDDEEQGKKELKYPRISYLERATFSTQAEYMHF